MKLCQFAKI